VRAPRSLSSSSGTVPVHSPHTSGFPVERLTSLRIMASKTCVFFETGTNAQFEYVLKQYPEAIKAKAHNKSSKPETLLKLDNW